MNKIIKYYKYTYKELFNFLGWLFGESKGLLKLVFSVMIGVGICLGSIFLTIKLFSNISVFLHIGIIIVEQLIILPIYCMLCEWGTKDI